LHGLRTSPDILPSTESVPESGLISAQIMRRNVVFPAPSAPTSAVITPLLISRSTPPKACTALPSAIRNVFLRF
jgi:hypothetical protein